MAQVVLVAVPPYSRHPVLISFLCSFPSPSLGGDSEAKSKARASTFASQVTFQQLEAWLQFFVESFRIAEVRRLGLAAVIAKCGVLRNVKCYIFGKASIQGCILLLLLSSRGGQSAPVEFRWNPTGELHWALLSPVEFRL